MTESEALALFSCLADKSRFHIDVQVRLTAIPDLWDEALLPDSAPGRAAKVHIRHAMTNLEVKTHD